MFLTVFSQICILMLLIFVGFFASKANILNESGVRCCTDIALILVTPCVIIKSLIRKFDWNILKSLLLCFAFSLLVHVLMIFLARLLVHDANQKRERVLRFSLIFTNCGFMSLPLQISLLGEDGALYGAAYIIVFTVLAWSYGIFLISGDRSTIAPKKLVFNPGLIGLFIGILLFIFSVPVPKVVYSSIEYMASMNTPLPMIVIGYHLSKANILKAFSDYKCLFAIFLRALLLPFAALGLLLLLGVRGTLLVSIVISASAPVAAMATMFSAKFDGDTALSVNMVSLSTICSLATMPFVITIAKLLA